MSRVNLPPYRRVYRVMRQSSNTATEACRHRWGATGVVVRAVEDRSHPGGRLLRGLPGGDGMTRPNAELAYAALDQIDAHPELHEQGYWFTVTDCGTAGCIAGWACLLSGDKPSPWDGLTMDDLSIGEQVAMVLTPNGERAEAGVRARQLLGLTEAEADLLFDAYNLHGDLSILVAEIFGPRPGAAS